MNESAHTKESRFWSIQTSSGIVVTENEHTPRLFHAVCFLVPKRDSRLFSRSGKLLEFRELTDTVSGTARIHDERIFVRPKNRPVTRNIIERHKVKTII